MSAVSSTPLQSALGEIELAASGAKPEVLVAVTELAIEIAREGREGRRVGTIFTVGAEQGYSGTAKPSFSIPWRGIRWNVAHFTKRVHRSPMKVALGRGDR
jgi:hypothetical protein